MDYLLALDQGTTSSRAIVFDTKGQQISIAQQETTLLTPQLDWVEQDPMQIWNTQIGVAQQAITNAGLLSLNIAAIGITNQRETTIVWHRKTGKPIAPAIIWQDRRTQVRCDERKPQHQETVARITGLRLDPYFSASKVEWILDNTPNARTQANAGELAFGTVDSWLIWNLTGGAQHVIDVSNASRTLLMNIHTGQWADDLLSLFNIPPSILPRIVPSSGVIGLTAKGLFAREIPIAAAIGDQQSALFGQGCTQVGMAKNTYGTGCFMLLNTGTDAQESHHQLLTTIAWTAEHASPTYALEGSVFMGGAVVKWLRDNLGIIKQSDEIEKLANQVASSEGVVLVPAFTGLGAPYWDNDAKALLCNMTRSTTKHHIARASLEAIAFQVADVLQAMQQDAPVPLCELRVDGGAAVNNLLMQFQADILGVPVTRPINTETTAMGAAMLAGLGVGIYDSIAATNEFWQRDRTFEPSMSVDQQQSLLEHWHKAIARAQQK